MIFVELVLISRWITTNHSFFVASEFSGIPLTIHHLNADFFREKKPCNLAHPFVKNKTFSNLLHINPGVRIYSVWPKKVLLLVPVKPTHLKKYAFLKLDSIFPNKKDEKHAVKPALRKECFCWSFPFPSKPICVLKTYLSRIGPNFAK